MKVFVDLNVILDILQERHPHFHDSYQAVDFLEKEEHQAYVSLHSIATLYYLLNKQVDKSGARKGVAWILNSFNLSRCSEEALWNALKKGYPDFEDGIVAEEAIIESCEAILTRNNQDFAASSIPALTPAEFLTRFFEK